MVSVCGAEVSHAFMGFYGVEGVPLNIPVHCHVCIGI